VFFKIISYYLSGYAVITVEGYFIERFINICISKKSSILFTNIGIKDFKRIREIAKKTKCRIKIQKKRGLPFLLHRYKKRKIFASFLMIILFIIVALSNFVWNIDIISESNIDKEELLNNLKECGLNIGILKSKVDTKEIINNIRLNRDDIAWIGIKVKGTNAIVEVVEADKKPEIIDENEYCNIVSEKDGIITKINVQNGTALVKVGDIVTKR
jgi:similar to stage IV sporulation protein